MGIELSAESWQVLGAFALYLVGVAALGIFSHRYLKRGEFVKEYFLGNRGLGPWVLAMTVAATAISGGTFMGFPSLIYTKGWVMALWIASYMVGPLVTMVLLGKRINQVARIAGAVTVPDVLRDRFRSPTLGIIATLLILLFLLFNLTAQFKGGATVMEQALRLRAPAQLLGAKEESDKALVLTFRLPDGKEVEQKTLLPAGAAFQEAKADDAAREVWVSYRTGDDKPAGKKVSYPTQKVEVFGVQTNLTQGYLIGLLLFALTVVAYTTYGGFWAVTWTDVLEGIVMLVGVVLLAVLAVSQVPPVTTASGETLHGLSAATESLRQQDVDLVYAPGPDNYLPLGLAFSFFLMWTLIAAGQPSGMVRLMSFKDTPSLRRALFLVCGYYVITYLCLLVIFVCARAIYPTEFLRDIGSEGKPDEIMPAMTRTVAPPFLAGLLMAAPYAAIMSTVAAFLLMISSSLVRDIYQRTINPNVSQRTVKRLSYVITAVVGVLVTLAALRPPEFLQYIIVFTGSGQGCSFLVPMMLGLYWKRATRAGMLAAMVGGFLVLLGLYALGWTDSHCQAALREHEQQLQLADAEGRPPPPPPTAAQWLNDRLGWVPGWGEKRLSGDAPLYVGGVDPLVWGLLTSLLLGVGVSLATRPDPELVKKYFPE